jgi:mercuric ion binding protein
MKNLALLAMVALMVGCADVNTAPETADNAESQTTAPEVAATPDTDVDTAPVTTAFDAGTEATLAIPEMHCPFGCFPKAKDALEEVAGIASVELVPQKKEGAIDDRRVVVKFDGSVSADTALAALDAVELGGSSFETAEN